jgi:predicted SAM-dependent methyltransferase
MLGRENLNDYNHHTRALIDWIERLCGALHRNQRYTPVAAPPVKVNLGSGLAIAPGWINVDGSLKTLLAKCPDFVAGLGYRFLTQSRAVSREQFVDLMAHNIFVHHNLKYGVPLPDASADFIYTSHTLHHLYRDEAAAVLADAFRALKPGGTIRIALPNLEYIFALYQRGEREQALTFFFYDSQPRNRLNRRQYQYDFELLRQMLAAIGYQPIRRCAFRQGRTPDLEQLDNRPDETLFVEADKPLSPRTNGARTAQPLATPADETGAPVS